MNYKKIIISIALLLTCVTLSAQQKAPDMEQQLVQRLQEAQMSGNDKEFYKAQDAFLRYLEKYNEWDKYYRTRMTRIIYEVNNKRFHRAFIARSKCLLISCSLLFFWKQLRKRVLLLRLQRGLRRLP